MRVVMSSLCLALALAAPVWAQAKKKDAQPFNPADAVAKVYKNVGDAKLKLFVFSPKDHKATDKTPAIVFFFGGGWTHGTPKQFEQQCRYLASRGMVAITAEYRVSSRFDVKAVDCVRDAKSAVRWVRDHASELGIDPSRIAAAGGSAGGHIAACTGTLEAFDESSENGDVSSRPNALVLFNPAVSFDNSLDNPKVPMEKWLSKKLGVSPEELSPAHHITGGAPPTLILIGTDDKLLEGNKQFAEKMKAAGNRCEIDLYDGRGHGFFNFGREGNKDFLATTESMDKFLTSLGYLQGPPTVQEFFAKK